MNQIKHPKWMRTIFIQDGKKFHVWREARGGQLQTVATTEIRLPLHSETFRLQSLHDLELQQRTRWPIYCTLIVLYFKP